jgi:hypothetical protein
VDWTFRSRLIGSTPDRFSGFQVDGPGWSSHLLVSLDEKMIEIFDPNQAEPWIFHVCDSVERLRQGSCKNHHVNPAACRGRPNLQRRLLPAEKRTNIIRRVSGYSAIGATSASSCSGLRSWSVDGLVAAGVVGVAGVCAVAATGVKSKRAATNVTTRRRAMLPPRYTQQPTSAFHARVCAGLICINTVPDKVNTAQRAESNQLAIRTCEGPKSGHPCSDQCRRLKYGRRRHHVRDRA